MIDTTTFILTVAFLVGVILSLWYRVNKRRKIWERDWNMFLKRNHEASEIIDYVTKFSEALTECIVAVAKLANPEDVFDDEERDASMAEGRRAYRRLLKISADMPTILEEHLPETNLFIANLRAKYDKEFDKIPPKS